MCVLRVGSLALILLGLAATGCWTNACIERTALGTARCWEDVGSIWDSADDYASDPNGEYQRNRCMTATTCKEEGYEHPCDDGYWHWDPCNQQ